MSRWIVASVCALTIAMGVAWGGDVTKQATTTGSKEMSAASADKMQAMQAEMMKCAVCKNIAAHMDEIGPMKAEVVKLNDGLAMVHSVTDASKLPAYRAASAATHKAGEACLTMTEEQASTQLCSFCQDIRSAMKAGAKMSVGETKMGDMMVMTSADPAVQTKLSALADKCALMAASM
ncbi:MAG TPA: hypothetical protein VNM87_08735 [Candidatus Udaeobacter sp.]|nr:hypothetical protein [Candidatus Udaeobacter sp.]